MSTNGQGRVAALAVVGLVVTTTLLMVMTRSSAPTSRASHFVPVPGAALDGLVYRSDHPIWYYVSLLTNGAPQCFVLHRDRVAGRVFLPPVHASWVVNAEPHVMASIDKLDCSEPNTLMVDVGSNDGSYSLLASLRGCRTVAFELQHLCIEYLKAAHNINGANPTIVVQHPVMDVSGKPFKVPTHSACSGTLGVTNTHKIVGDMETLTSVALDDVFPAARIAWLKIDIEGFEPIAMQGAKKLFARRAVDAAAVESVLWAREMDLADAFEKMAFVFDHGYDIQCMAIMDASALKSAALSGKIYHTRNEWMTAGLADFRAGMYLDLTPCMDVLVCPQHGCKYRR